MPTVTTRTFSQSVSLTQYVVLSVCPSACLFQLASESLRDIVARRRSDYCPRGAIFTLVSDICDAMTLILFLFVNVR